VKQLGRSGGQKGEGVLVFTGHFCQGGRSRFVVGDAGALKKGVACARVGGGNGKGPPGNFPECYKQVPGRGKRELELDREGLRAGNQIIGGGGSRDRQKDGADRRKS